MAKSLSPVSSIVANGRLATFAVLIEVLGKGLHLKARPLDPKVAEMAKQLFDLPQT
jgi:hypothetical protein